MIIVPRGTMVNGVIRGGSYYGDVTNGVRERSGIRVQARVKYPQVVVGFRLNGVRKGAYYSTGQVIFVRSGARSGNSNRRLGYEYLGFL